MSAIAQTAAHPLRWTESIWTLLRDEFAPYDGRGVLVARIVIASTLVMLVCMTFQLSYAPLAATYAFLISRASLESTAGSMRVLLGANLIAGAYLIFSAMFVLGSPVLRFVWTGASLFIVFYCLSALRNYTAAVTFGLMITFNISLLDSHTSANLKVESILRAVGAIGVGSAVTVLVELAFAASRRTDELTKGICERLSTVESLLRSCAEGQEVPRTTAASAFRLAGVGTSGLRRILQRSGLDVSQKERLAAVVDLSGRLVDLGAALSKVRADVGQTHRNRVSLIARNISEIKVSLQRKATLGHAAYSGENGSWPEAPLLSQIEGTTALMRAVLGGSPPPAMVTAVPQEHRGPSTLFVAGATSDPAHLRSALKGCLASGLGYIAFTALFWPGLATCVYTCVVTALTTIGSSHQRQALRFVGAAIGGIVMAMGAQVFILPFVDSIGAFVVMFSVATGAAAWTATSSARLSFLGVQIALAFNLVTLQGFRFQTSLSLGRDRVIGVVLGLCMMWLAFDTLWTKSAAVDMKKGFVLVLRSLAQFAREPVSEDLRAGHDRQYVLREFINAKFDEVRSAADSMLFEFGPSRDRDLALRDCICEWQPRLRSLFLLRIAAANYRLQMPAFELPQAIRVWHRDYDFRSAGLLDAMAAWIEGSQDATQISTESMKEIEGQRDSQANSDVSTTILSVLTLLQDIDSLTTSLAEDIANRCRGKVDYWT